MDLDVLTEPFVNHVAMANDIMSGVDHGQECRGHPEHQRPRHGGVLGMPTPPIEYGAAQDQALFGAGLPCGLGLPFRSGLPSYARSLVALGLSPVPDGLVDYLRLAHTVHISLGTSPVRRSPRVTRGHRRTSFGLSLLCEYFGLGLVRTRVSALVRSRVGASARSCHLTRCYPFRTI